MTKQMIKLTKAQADAVRAKIGVYELRPRKIDRNYYLPTVVLDNQAYAEAFTLLLTLPIVELEIVEQNND